MKQVATLFLLLLIGLGCGSDPATTAADPSAPETEPKDSTPMETIDPALLEVPTQGPIPALERKDGVIQLTWKVLGIMDFYEDYSEELDQYIPFPIFNDTLKAIEGERVSIEGYVIPVEETGDETLIVLSAFPYTQCFFCGNAGPESVMDIQLKKSAGRLSQDDVVRFRGRLKLNDSDFYYLNYILEEAERVD